MKFLGMLKGKLVSILMFIIGILSLSTMWYKSSRDNEKMERAQDELADDKAATKYANGAAEAVTRGAIRENTKKDNSKRKFIDFS